MYRTAREIAAEAIESGVDPRRQDGTQKTTKELVGEHDRNCRERDKRTDWTTKR